MFRAAITESLIPEFVAPHSGQPDNERYLNYVADKFDLRKDIQFDTRVTSAIYDEQANRWDLQLESGQRARAQFLIAAVGLLSARYTPPFEGVESFQGESFHTSRWPKEKVDFTGKRVAVIGTGATAVQLLPEIAKEVGHLTVFQRTPNYCAPCRNSLVTPEEQRSYGVDSNRQFTDGQIRSEVSQSVRIRQRNCSPYSEGE